MPVRSAPEIVLAGVVSVGLLAYGAFLASVGVDGSVGMAIAGSVSAVATGIGVYTATKRKLAK